MLVPLENSDKVAIVDDGWEEDVLCQKWFLTTPGYAATRIGQGIGFPGYLRIQLHQLIMGEKPGFEIDHINGNRLDNRTANLRHVTISQQRCNSAIRYNNRSGHKGVSFEPTRTSRRKWHARITLNKCHKNLGYFETFEEACLAREQAEREIHGEYARKESNAIDRETDGFKPPKRN